MEETEDTSSAPEEPMAPPMEESPVSHVQEMFDSLDEEEKMEMCRVAESYKESNPDSYEEGKPLTGELMAEEPSGEE